MRMPIIAVVLGAFLSGAAVADVVQLREDAPDRYVVVKGDTLWDISSRFLKSPWRWPEIWNLNRDQIKDPHWIYPGDVIAMDRAAAGAEPGLRLIRSEKYEGRDTVVVSPTIRTEARESSDAIPAISPNDLGPFLSQPLVIEKNELESAPTIVAAEENRVIIGVGDKAFVTGMDANSPRHWQIFRPGKKLVDPETGDTLGYEAIYLGDAEITAYPKKDKEAATMQIRRSVMEINKGDRLVRSRHVELSRVLPHGAESKLRGQIMSIYSGVAEAGPKSIITINRGSNDGVEQGHVLSLSRLGREVSGPNGRVKTPEEEYGVAMVFRTFNRVSYAVIMQSRLPAHTKDFVGKP